jgi:hypothetical protein
VDLVAKPVRSPGPDTKGSGAHPPPAARVQDPAAVAGIHATGSFAGAYFISRREAARIRVHCLPCDRQFYGCFAKRLSPIPDEGGNREWWGPVGKWMFRERTQETVT